MDLTQTGSAFMERFFPIPENLSEIMGLCLAHQPFADQALVEKIDGKTVCYVNLAVHGNNRPHFCMIPIS